MIGRYNSSRPDIMPFLRTPKGKKIAFTPARLSTLLSLVYLEAIGGEKISRHRGQIQQHCFRIWSELETTFGERDDDEWPGEGIKNAIDGELKIKAPLEVHEAFSSMRINEFQSSPKQAKKEDPTWNKFEPKPLSTKPMELLDTDHIDPVWSILIKKPSASGTDNSKDTDTDTETSTINETVSNPNGLASSLAQRLGVAARIDSVKKKTLFENQSLQVRRSHWIAFWKNLPKNQIPWSVWEKHILGLTPDQKNRQMHEWWAWWQEQIDVCLKTSPQLYELRRALLERKRRGDVLGQHWIDGPELTTQKMFRLDYSGPGTNWYQKIATEHLKNIFSENFPYLEWDWNLIQRSIIPERDRLVEWKAWQHLDEAGALWDLDPNKPWGHGERPAADSKELPQWAWMRVAMGMAAYDPEQHLRTKNAVDLYNKISQMHLIPSAASVREAGKADPRFFEDQTWDVPDHFSSIQKVIYSAAVDTTWTGTSASVWSRVRSKNAPVRAGRRKSTGVNDFLRTIDSHLKAQGRMGDDRPVTVMLDVWHLDMEEFITLQHENGQRLQPVLLVSDLFMQRVAENGVWNLFDPHVYPEVLDGEEGYIKAEECISERKKTHPHAHKTISSEKIWKKILTQSRQGSPFITYSNSDQAFAISSDIKIVHGLDGVGAFPVPDIGATQHPACIQWPTLAININSMMSDQGEPLLEEWRETLAWAFWMAERMYEACGSHVSEETTLVRPLCLGAVGFYEAIQKAMMGSYQNEEVLSTWIYKISEAFATLTTVVDQVFCQKNGPAPIWNDLPNPQPFHPQEGFARLKKQRNGGIGIPALPEEMSDIFEQISAHRFSVRTVWAPFHQAATWAGVSPGGFGTLFPVEWVLDEDRQWRLTPTSFLLSEIRNNVTQEDYGSIFQFPEQPSKWPAHIRQLCAPDMTEWKTRLKHASLVRSWVDQGVSLTLPAGLPVAQLSLLLQQAWWMGLSNVRFEDPFKKPDLGGVGSEDTSPEDDE